MVYLQVNDLKMIGKRVHVDVKVNKAAASICIAGFENEVSKVGEEITQILNKQSGIFLTLFHNISSKRSSQDQLQMYQRTKLNSAI